MELSPSHPAYGLVSRRQFDRRRGLGLVPGPINRRRRKTGYGTEVEYPEGARRQLIRELELEDMGVRGPVALRLALWAEGYRITERRLRGDLKTFASGFDAFRQQRGERDDDLAADAIVMGMVRSHAPNPVVSLALARLHNPADVEAAFLNICQLMFGTPPSDLELDGQSAKPLARMMELIMNAGPIDATALSDVISHDEGFAAYFKEFERLPEWSIEDWTQGRNDVLALSLSGGFLPPSPILRGWLFLGARLSAVIGAVALRRIDPTGWNGWLDRASQSLNQTISA